MNNAAKIVAILFASREAAHREHLNTSSYAQHVALGDFYTKVIDLADSFAETWMGLNGKIGEIPYEKPASGSIDDVLEHYVSSIEQLRGSFNKVAETCLLNILDEISALYTQTLYKLRILS